jgi:polyisoprenoid-binding protein YceI
MKTSRSLFVAAAVIAASPLLAADTYSVDKGHSEATFTVKHLVSKVSGRFNDFSGNVVIDAAKPEASSVEFTIKAASINTDNADRDKHLKTPDFFDVEKNPEITFKSSKVTPAGKDKFNVDGTLTLHGVSKQITLPVEFQGFVKDPWGNEKAGFALETTINRKDYGMVWNKALDQGGYLLGDDVKIVINLEAAKKK